MSILDEFLTCLPMIRDRQRKLHASLDQRRLDAGTLIKMVDLLLTERARDKARLAEYEKAEAKR